MRRYYDGLILFAKLTESDFDTWYHKCYQVSSVYYPDGIFQSIEEKKDYENSNHNE